MRNLAESELPASPFARGAEMGVRRAPPAGEVGGARRARGDEDNGLAQVSEEPDLGDRNPLRGFSAQPGFVAHIASRYVLSMPRLTQSAEIVPVG